MRLRVGGILWVFAIFLLPFAVQAADFGAEIVDVDGKVYVIQKATGKKIAAKTGMRVGPGDAIETAENAEAEILYDDGNVTRLDEETRLEISKLSVDTDKSRESVLNLAYGRVKNSVSKLVTTKSKFEVNTKTVTGGVTGTPPWVVNVVGGKDSTGPAKTEVDLLKGEKGSVVVRGTDPKATAIVLTPGTRTIAQAGMPPMNAFPISAARLNELQAKLPITTPPAVRQEKRQQLDTAPVEVSKDKKDEKKKEDVKKSDEPAKSDAKDDSTATSGNGGGKGDVEPVVGGAPGGVEPPGGTGVTESANTGASGAGGGSATSKAGPAGGTGLAIDYMTHVVSVAPVAAPSTTSPPGQDPTGQSTDTQISQGSNALAGAATSAISATTRVRVQVGIVYK